ncbi:hypothetical protein [Neosynechococcus sphagnicola]|uniref:hypothetical protein n=1 Tax=Neosynechococcus sphagnicola TaxID=1501145 RepID=UPI0012E08BEF|nr:hypothetical protein [Neosynechococcus sphagnicola]
MNSALVVSEPVRNDRGQVVIPQGSRLEGQFQSVTVNGNPGARYIANRVVIGNRSFSIQAVSRVRSATRDITRQNVEGGVATAAARQGLSSLFGDLVSNILVGGVAGPVNSRGRAYDRLIIFNPEDLQLILSRDWVRPDNLQR